MQEGAGGQNPTLLLPIINFELQPEKEIVLLVTEPTLVVT